MNETTINQIITAPPRKLAMEDYERDWKPLGWQLIIIGPTSTWRQDWGEWEAIRDIVQNALDETEHYSWGYDAEGLYIRDSGKGIAVADFLLGPPRLKPDYARGKFGEGMKIAALALLRLGYPVRVETVGRELWIIFLEQKVNGKAETLSAMWRANGGSSGTVFHIIGYHGSAFEDRFAVNLPPEAIVTEGPSKLTEPIQRYNQLIKHRFPLEAGHGWYEEGAGASRVFARDIYMKDIKSPYSYNLWSFDMAPDRHAPKEESHMWIDMGRLWACVNQVEHLETFLQMVKAPPVLQTDESFNVDMGSWNMGREPSTGRDYADFVRDNAPAWQQAWKNVMGEDAVMRTNDKHDSMVRHLGYQSISLSWGVTDTLSRAITTDKELIQKSQDQLREAEIVTEERLDERQRAHLALARAIAAEVFHAAPPVYVAVIPPASDRVRTAGMYSTATGEIYISLEIIDQGRTMIDALIHEMAHHRQYRRTGEAADLTPTHAEAMTHTAAEVVRHVSSGALDYLLKEVAW